MPGTALAARHAKFLIAAAAAASVFLETMYPTARWEHAVTAAIGAFLVYLVPNAPKPPVVPGPAARAAQVQAPGPPP